MRVPGTRATVAGSPLGRYARIPSPQGILAGGAMPTHRASNRASGGTAGAAAYAGVLLPPVAAGFLPAREGRRHGSASTPIKERQAEFRRLSASVDDLVEQAAIGE